jgi:hypothetical protein
VDKLSEVITPVNTGLVGRPDEFGAATLPAPEEAEATGPDEAPAGADHVPEAGADDGDTGLDQKTACRVVLDSLGRAGLAVHYGWRDVPPDCRFLALESCPFCHVKDGLASRCGVIVRADGGLVGRCARDPTVGWPRFREYLKWGPEPPPVSYVLGMDSSGPYGASPEGMYVLSSSNKDIIRKPLTNFVARVVAESVRDDGAERRSVFVVEAEVDGKVSRFPVPADRFESLDWVLPNLGPRALVHPGPGVKDLARAAIQLFSTDAATETVYTHTGWREHGGEQVYLHSGGAIGAGGPVSGVRVDLGGPLERYRLPEPPDGDDLCAAVRASLDLLGAARDGLTVPLFDAVYRAPLGSTDFSLHLTGPTGEGKSTLAALALQHYGAGLDAGHTPANWSWTANAIEGLAFLAKDAVLVIDDFAPGGTAQDATKLHREADRLFRNQGNNAGRGRQLPHGDLRPVRPPRGTILSTGEEVPRGQSLRARLLVLEVSPGMVDWRAVTRLQNAAAAGRFAAAMAGYLKWLAGRYDEVRREMPVKVRELRGRAAEAGMHRRTPGIVADLQFGVEAFARFAVDSGALTGPEAEALCARSWRALGAAAAHQVTLQLASEPARRFVDLLNAALVSGRAHLAARSGGQPPGATGWGWRQDGFESWQPRGDRIGWVAGDTVFLEPEAAYAAAQRLAHDGGELLAVSNTTLFKRMHERGMLAVVDAGRNRLTVRKTVERKNREVLCVRAAMFGLGETPDEEEDAEDEDAAWGAPRNAGGRRGG